MPVVDAILQPYIDAPTLREAEQELDRLAGPDAELPVPLGDLYDELAGAAADDGRRAFPRGAHDRGSRLNSAQLAGIVDRARSASAA